MGQRQHDVGAQLCDQRHITGEHDGVAESLLGGYVSTSYDDVLLYAILFGIIIFRPEVLGLGAEPA